MKYLKTVLKDKDGHVIENAYEHFTSLQEIRVAVAAQEWINPVCCMWVWKTCQDTSEVPFKIIHAPHIQRRKAGAR